MIEQHIEVLIAKYCTNQITPDELVELNNWLETENNKTLFKEYVALNFFIEEVKPDNKFEKDVAWETIAQSIVPKDKGKNYWKYVAAAAIAVLISLPFVINESSLDIPDSQTTSRINNSIKIGSDKATLTLENGTDVVLQKGKAFTNAHVSPDGKKLVYDKKGSEGTAYNYLTIPRGGEFFVELSDGTKVWLNSESKLKYPVHFKDGETRKVELLYGEAYFDVSPSEHHAGSKFKVIQEKQDITVLGTKFNLKAYQDDTDIHTTLVEGEVSITNAHASTILRPNQQAVLKKNEENQDITVSNIDVSAEIAWVNGDFIFQRKSLKQIAKTLMRWYDIDIIIKDEVIKNTEFTGRLSKYQNIEEILILIKETKHISAYEIKENAILIY